MAIRPVDHSRIPEEDPFKKEEAKAPSAKESVKGAIDNLAASFKLRSEVKQVFDRAALSFLYGISNLTDKKSKVDSQHLADASSKFLSLLSLHVELNVQQFSTLHLEVPVDHARLLLITSLIDHEEYGLKIVLNGSVLEKLNLAFEEAEKEEQMDKKVFKKLVDQAIEAVLKEHVVPLLQLGYPITLEG